MNHPNIHAEPIVGYLVTGGVIERSFMEGDKWRLVLLQMIPEVSWRDGIVVPTLGEAVGDGVDGMWSHWHKWKEWENSGRWRGEARPPPIECPLMEWFKGRGYDGTQTLVRANVVKFPKVRYSQSDVYPPEYEEYGLECIEQGIINLEAIKIYQRK